MPAVPGSTADTFHTIPKGDEGPQRPPSGYVDLSLNALMEDNPLRRVPNPGGKFPGGTVRLAVLDNRRNDTLQIGEGFNRYP
jgi:hypothetical protein